MDIGSRVGQAVLRKDNGLQVHPFNREKVIILMVQNFKLLFVFISRMVQFVFLCKCFLVLGILGRVERLEYA